MNIFVANCTLNLLLAWPHLRVVCICVEHDDAICQHVSHVSTLEGACVALDVALRKLLHEPINLLSLAGQPAWTGQRAHEQLKDEGTRTMTMRLSSTGTSWFWQAEQHTGL